MQSRLLAVYAPYVEHTAITFEYEVPDLEEFQKTDRHDLTALSLSCVREGKRDCRIRLSLPLLRVGLPMTIAIFIYVKDSMRKCGIGRRLYEEIERIAREQHLLSTLTPASDIRRRKTNI